MPSVLMNIYVVGLNQIFDVEIDKVGFDHFYAVESVLSLRTKTWRVQV